MGNGRVEGLNSSVLRMLRILEENCGLKWMDELNKFIYA